MNEVSMTRWSRMNHCPAKSVSSWQLSHVTDRCIDFNLRKCSSLGSLRRTANYYQRCTLLWRTTLLLHTTCTAKYGLEVRDKFCYCHIRREECSTYWPLDHIVHSVGWNIDLVCDTNNDATSHSWYELIQSLNILKALELHKLEGLVMFPSLTYVIV